MSSPQQESFQSMATVFILQDKTWIERGSGLVRFVFDLRTFALRLVIRPGTPDEFECKLRPRIRSKGPRAYVVRAQAENGTDEHILAVRFEREEDSRSFRRFVEKRDVDHNQKNNSNSNAQNPSSYPSAHLRNQTDYTNNSAVQQQYGSSRHNNRGSSNIAQNGYNQYQSHAMRAVQAQQQQVNGANNAYNNTMYGSPNNNNIQSPSSGNNNNKHGSGVQANYFWTCSRCLQMVDPSLTSCHVCGTLRQENQNQNNTNYHHQSGNPNGIQQINNPNNNNNPNVLQQINGPNNYSSHHHGNNNNIINNNNNNHSNIHNSNIHSNTHSNHPSNLASYGSNVHHQIRNPSTLHNSSHHPSYPSHHPSGSGGSHPSSQHHPNVIQQPNVHILKLTTVNLEKHNKLFPPKRRNVKEIIQTQLEWLRTHQ